MSDKEKESQPKDKGEENNEKRAQADETNDRVQELTSNLQRLQAEFENYKKRVQTEQQAYCLSANKNLITDLLQVLDNFELALVKEEKKDGFYKGVELIYSSLYTMLEKHGLKRIEALNQRFEPRLHEALLTEESEAEPNTVIEELQKGYVLHDTVLRHSKVKVAKPKTSNTEAATRNKGG